MNRQPKQPKASYNFSFENFRITNVKFSVNESFNPAEGAEINPEIGMEPNYNPETKLLRLKIGVRQNNDNGPFLFEVIGEGFFRFNKNPDANSLAKISSINCPAIMFPFLREMVADITGRSGFAPLLLAPVNFIALAEKKGAKKRDKKALIQ